MAKRQTADIALPARLRLSGTNTNLVDIIMRILTLSFFLATLLGLAACETVKGVGRDITNAGQAVDNAI